MALGCASGAGAAGASSAILGFFARRARGGRHASTGTIRCNELHWTELCSPSSSGVSLDSHSPRVERNPDARRMPSVLRGGFVCSLDCARSPARPVRIASRPRSARWREAVCPRMEDAGSTPTAQPDWYVKRAERAAQARAAKAAVAGPEEAVAMEGPAGMPVPEEAAARVKGAGIAPRPSPPAALRRT